ncbi:MAG: proline hydroxylase [Planctomycetota bacterium]|nr:MAG: proline hydroxylase [Planctomycetota bacterium]
MSEYSVKPEALLERAYDLRETYRGGDPFPHIVIDNFFPEPIVDQVLDEFPSPASYEWQEFKNSRERKLASSNEKLLGPATRRLIWEMNSQVFLEFLQVLTGIDNLISDPMLLGGGLHQIERGGKLGLHADFNKHQQYKLDRRLNLLLYLNKDWEEEYGGHFELWDRDVKRCAKKVLPIFNRIAVFSTTEHSWHGHPDPLNCPEGMSRKSLALYYYTNGRPENEEAAEHSTVFRTRPGEVLEREKTGPKIGLRDFVPPIMLRAARRVLGKKSKSSVHG